MARARVDWREEIGEARRDWRGSEQNGESENRIGRARAEWREEIGEVRRE